MVSFNDAAHAVRNNASRKLTLHILVYQLQPGVETAKGTDWQEVHGWSKSTHPAEGVSIWKGDLHGD